MAIHWKARVGTIVLLFPLAVGGASALAASPTTLTAGAAARSTHSTQALPAALRPVFYRALAKDAGAAYQINKDGCAVLPKQKLKACFDAQGAHFTGATPVSLHLVAFGRNGELSPVETVRPAIHGNQVNYEHGNLSEWWRVLPMGFEQGFTIARRPGGHGKLTLALTTSRQDAGAPSGKGTLAWGKLRYGKLVVTDANGKVVPATLKSKGGSVLIVVNDARAAYPLTVDPLLWRQEYKFTDNPGNPSEDFGYAVALQGATALIGASGADVNNNTGQGAVYVFHESGVSWSLAATLAASDGTAGDGFGTYVALDGSTALVGASGADVNGHPDQGAAYVFCGANASWSQTAKLTASDGAAGDRFGGNVALDGAIALVGAPFADIGSNTDQGAAYVFEKSGVSWSETKKLYAIAPYAGGPNDNFGGGMAVDDTTAGGPTAIIGAYAATINGNFAQGAAWVFQKIGSSWTQMTRLTAINGAQRDRFGVSVALEGTTALIGAYQAFDPHPYQGAVYFFQGAGVSWTQMQEFTSIDGAALDRFGSSVALDGSTALIGAYLADVSSNTDQGAAYVFEETGVTWAQTKKLTANDGLANDRFGIRVALAGATALIGAYLADAPNTDQGAAYFYGPCQRDYTEFDGYLDPYGAFMSTPITGVLAGTKHLRLYSPPSFGILAIANNSPPAKYFPINKNVNGPGPAGSYRVGVLADATAGNYALCVKL